MQPQGVSSGNRGRDLFEQRKRKAQEQEAADIRKAAQQAMESADQAQWSVISIVLQERATACELHNTC